MDYIQYGKYQEIRLIYKYHFSWAAEFRNQILLNNTVKWHEKTPSLPGWAPSRKSLFNGTKTLANVSDTRFKRISSDHFICTARPPKVTGSVSIKFALTQHWFAQHEIWHPSATSVSESDRAFLQPEELRFQLHFTRFRRLRQLSRVATKCCTLEYQRTCVPYVFSSSLKLSPGICLIYTTTMTIKDTC